MIKREFLKLYVEAVLGKLGFKYPIKSDLDNCGLKSLQFNREVKNEHFANLFHKVHLSSFNDFSNCHNLKDYLFFLKKQKVTKEELMLFIQEFKENYLSVEMGGLVKYYLNSNYMLTYIVIELKKNHTDFVTNLSNRSLLNEYLNHIEKKVSRDLKTLNKFTEEGTNNGFVKYILNTINNFIKDFDFSRGFSMETDKVSLYNEVSKTHNYKPKINLAETLRILKEVSFKFYNSNGRMLYDLIRYRQNKIIEDELLEVNRRLSYIDPSIKLKLVKYENENSYLVSKIKMRDEYLDIVYHYSKTASISKFKTLYDILFDKCLGEVAVIGSKTDGKTLISYSEYLRYKDNRDEINYDFLETVKMLSEGVIALKRLEQECTLASVDFKTINCSIMEDNRNFSRYCKVTDLKFIREKTDRVDYLDDGLCFDTDKKILIKDIDSIFNKFRTLKATDTALYQNLLSKQVDLSKPKQVYTNKYVSNLLQDNLVKMSCRYNFFNCFKTIMDSFKSVVDDLDNVQNVTEHYFNSNDNTPPNEAYVYFGLLLVLKMIDEGREIDTSSLNVNTVIKMGVTLLQKIGIEDKQRQATVYSSLISVFQRLPLINFKSHDSFLTRFGVERDCFIAYYKISKILEEINFNALLMDYSSIDKYLRCLNVNSEEEFVDCFKVYSKDIKREYEYYKFCLAPLFVEVNSCFKKIKQQVTYKFVGEANLNIQNIYAFEISEIIKYVNRKSQNKDSMLKVFNVSKEIYYLDSDLARYYTINEDGFIVNKDTKELWYSITNNDEFQIMHKSGVIYYYSNGMILKREDCDGFSKLRSEINW